MKTEMMLTLGMVAAAWGLPVSAQEVGKVLSATPVVRQVAVPRQVCRTDNVVVPEQKSGAGALMGAIAGGAIGNAIGDGAGRAAATMLGMVGGSVVGDRIEGSPSAKVQQVQRCEWQQVYENQTVSYQVVYEYAGRQYSVEWPQDPGPTIPLQVAPVVPQSAAPSPVVDAPPVVMDATPVYVQPYPYPAYPAVSPSVRLYWGTGRWPGRY